MKNIIAGRKSRKVHRKNVNYGHERWLDRVDMEKNILKNEFAGKSEEIQRWNWLQYLDLRSAKDVYGQGKLKRETKIADLLMSRVEARNKGKNIILLYDGFKFVFSEWYFGHKQF